MNYKKRYKKGNYRMFLAGGVDDPQANALNMYNTGQIGSGGAPVGSTSTIVEQESNPELQEARLQNLTEQQQLLLQQQQQVENQAIQEAAENEIINKQKLLQSDAEYRNALNTKEQTASTGIKLGAELLAPEVVAANKLKSANVYSQLGKDVMAGFKAMKPVQEFTQTIPGSMQLTSMGTAAGTGFKAGLGKIGAGLGKFAKTGAGIGTIASLAGAGISRLSNDNDPTTLNFGEGAGGVISSAGSGMALGSMLGPVGTLIGGIGGGLWGLGKGLWSRNKARNTERDLEQESNKAQSQNINRFNEDLLSNYGSALSNIRQGELAQKAISGQDLGYNLVARKGGVRSYDHGGPHQPDGSRMIGPGTLEQHLSTQNVLPEVNVMGNRPTMPTVNLPEVTVMGNRGVPRTLGAVGAPGMNIMQQLQNRKIGSTIGRGVLGNVANNFGRGIVPETIVPETPIVNNPNLILGSEGMPSPMVRRGGGMRMGVPRYGYAV